MSEVATKAKTAEKKGWFEIEIQLANDQEDQYVFVGGCTEGDFRIKRGHKVIVPPGVIERLDNAVKGVDERDPHDEMKVVTVERKRFAYTIHRAL